MPSLGGFLCDRTGSGSILAIAGMIIAAASAALAVDIGRIYAIRANLEATADAAALAAAAYLNDPGRATAVAIRYAEKNMPADRYGAVVKPEHVRFGDWDSESQSFTDTSERPTAIKVDAVYSLSETSGLKLFFAPLFGVETFQISVDAVAGSSSPPCILVLEPRSSGNFVLTDRAKITTTGCGVQINSADRRALRMAGRSRLVSEGNCVSGGAHISGAAAAIPVPKEYCPKVVDPMASLSPLAAGPCTESHLVIHNRTRILLPGVYCGGLRITGRSNVTLAPGSYIIKGGPLELEGRSALRGARVFIQFDDAAALSKFGKHSTINLSAPETGPYAGILMFQDRGIHGSHMWDSRNVERMIGTIYFREADIAASGASPLTPLRSCSVIIVDGLYLKNRSGISIDVNGSNCQNLLPAPFRKNVSLLK